MDAEIARNQNYDDHYANDSKDVHSALLPLHDDARSVLDRHVSRRCDSKLVALGQRRHGVRRRASKFKSSPTPIAPIATSSEEEKQHKYNKNEVHIFLQNIAELPT